jgi:ferredoxin
VAAVATDPVFEVELASSGRELTVRPEQSILSVLEASGLSPDSSCEAGICGACRTRYLGGEVDHRDVVLTDLEREDHLMICVSRSKGPRLILDL